MVFILFLFAAAVGALNILTTTSMSSRESLYYAGVEKFVDVSHSGRLQALNPMTVNKYVYSLPFRVGEPLGLRAQLALMRFSGLVFLLGTMWLCYQAIGKLFPEDDFFAVAALALLATNNRLMFTAVAIEGAVFFFFLYALFIYILIEVISRGSLVDIMIGLALVLMISQFDPLTSERIIMPLLFLAIIAAFLLAYRKPIIEKLPSSNQQRAAIAAAIFIGLAVAARNWAPIGILLQSPASVWYAIGGLFSWPEIITHLSSFYAGAPLLPVEFRPMQAALTYAFQVSAIIAVAGVVGFMYAVLSERVKVVRTRLEPANGEPAVSVKFVALTPKDSILTRINVAGLLIIALTPLTVFAAVGTYIRAQALNENLLVILLIPLTLLMTLGLKHMTTIKSIKIIAPLSLVGLLTVNIAVALITILWR